MNKNGGTVNSNTKVLKFLNSNVEQDGGDPYTVLVYPESPNYREHINTYTDYPVANTIVLTNSSSIVHINEKASNLTIIVQLPDPDDIEHSVQLGDSICIYYGQPSDSNENPTGKLRVETNNSVILGASSIPNKDKNSTLVDSYSLTYGGPSVSHITFKREVQSGIHVGTVNSTSPPHQDMTLYNNFLGITLTYMGEQPSPSGTEYTWAITNVDTIMTWSV
jgi:hypothetical protein